MRRSRPSLASPMDNEDLLEEILLRIHPQPSAIPRASLVCKRWHRILSYPRFLRRFHKYHHDAPLLGFFKGYYWKRHVFTPILDSPNRIPAARFSVPRSNHPYEKWDFFGCRHGLAVMLNDYWCEAIVWDPLTGQQHRVPFPPGHCTATRWSFQNRHAAVLCVDGENQHVHSDCFSIPFNLILIWSTNRTHAFACMYKSTSGAWGSIASTATISSAIWCRPSILIGNSIYWMLYGGDVLVFDIEKQSLGMIEKPVHAHRTDVFSFQLLRIDGTVLGFAVLSELNIQLWKRTSNYNEDGGWVLFQKTIPLEGLFPQGMRSDEDSNMIVLSTFIGDFMLQLESMRFITISKRDYWDDKIFYPYRGVGWKCVDQKL